MEYDYLSRILILIPLLLSLSIHECAHAWAAYMLGDDTAKHLGRITLNPIPHIDPVGTLLLPLMGVPFGWARPVPVNPVRFHRKISMEWGMLLTAAAGPASNILLAVISFVILWLMGVVQPELLQTANAGRALLHNLIFLNALLAVFNLLPIPPLDGSRIADALIPYKLRPMWENFERMGPIVLLAVIILPNILGFNIFYWPLRLLQSILGGM
jgi:Zn-dependent protease